MHTRIPPPIVTFFFLAINYLVNLIFPQFKYSTNILIGFLLILLGISILIYAAKEFKKVQTTINPMSPDKASYLVTSGPFNISRNPMYLGMVFIILGSGISFGALLTPIFIVSFMIYITVFQIIPEEKVMSQKFTEWSDYSKKTRRWL